MMLVSCKEDDEPVPLSEQILGTWKETMTVSHFYDEQSKELHKESFAISTEYGFGAESFYRDFCSRVPIEYTIIEEGGKHYLVVEGDPVGRYELSISGDKMIWSWENHPATYYYYPSDELKAAHRQTVRIEFKRVK
ncbi:hypothetical protein [Pontibacter harenae]|uniref:hypothetical protein n=1 Tax=Pontibacter harenae TaxID=2894083 RepID=UPI001E3A84CF|nr:hypothetical protein [Pontibacter harenae]MCC9168602.1 hypothetical protein [Pontibacter harenae]